MTAPHERHERRQLHPLPRGLVELYGLIAVLVVLIPEWLADGTLNIGQATAPVETLPTRARAWRILPELRLAAMSLRELRRLAQQQRVGHYASLSRDQLTLHLLKRLRNGERRRTIRLGAGRRNAL